MTNRTIIKIEILSLVPEVVLYIDYINHKSRENEEVVFEIVCDGLYTDRQTDR